MTMLEESHSAALLQIATPTDWLNCKSIIQYLPSVSSERHRSQPPAAVAEQISVHHGRQWHEDTCTRKVQAVQGSYPKILCHAQTQLCSITKYRTSTEKLYNNSQCCTVELGIITICTFTESRGSLNSVPIFGKYIQHRLCQPHILWAQISTY